MPTYANLPRYQEPTPEAKSDRILQNVAGAVGGYQKLKATEHAQAVIANPKATPIEKAMALASIGQEKLGTEVFKKAADQSVLSGIEERLNQNLGRGQPNIPGATPPIRPNEPVATQPGATEAGTATQPGFSQNGPTNAARNATALQPNAQPPMMAGAPQAAPQPQVDPEQEAQAYEQAAMEAAKENRHDVATQYGNKANQIRKTENDKNKAAATKFTGDRAYAHKTNKTFHEDIEATSKKLPQAQMLLDMAQQAVDSGEVGPLSRANLSKRLRIKELNSPPGAALDAAVKGALINNVSKLSAKGLNMFMEKVALSAYAQVGESIENNQIKLEAARAEIDLARAEIQAYDKQLEEDLAQFGSEQPFLKRRADKFLEPMQKEIANRSSYKMKKILERADGYAKLEKKWSKTVPHGTPLTPEMGRILLNKTESPEKMIALAKKLGYTILSAEQIASYE